MKVSSEVAQVRRAWGVSARDVVNSIVDAGSTRPGGTPTQVNVSKHRLWLVCSELSRGIIENEDIASGTASLPMECLCRLKSAEQGRFWGYIWRFFKALGVNFGIGLRSIRMP